MKGEKLRGISTFEHCMDYGVWTGLLGQTHIQAKLDYINCPYIYV